MKAILALVFAISVILIFVKSHELKNFQITHVLDPSIPEFKYYSSWNSDKWIQWLRQRYIQDQEDRKNKTISSDSDLTLYGTWVNIVIIASMDEIQSAFSSNSTPAYTSLLRSDYYWSDIPFPVYVIIRTNGTNFNVHNCSGKRMFINARIESGTNKPVELKTFFPKPVKNPGDKLRVPLTVCSKVSQVRGLLDEIIFTLGTRNAEKIV